MVIWKSLWLFGNPCGYLEIPVVIWKSLWLFGNPCGYLEIPVVIWKSLWLFGNPCGYLEIPVVIWKSLWLFGNPCGYLEIPVVIWKFEKFPNIGSCHRQYGDSNSLSCRNYAISVSISTIYYSPGLVQVGDRIVVRRGWGGMWIHLFFPHTNSICMVACFELLWHIDRINPS